MTDKEAIEELESYAQNHSNFDENVREAIDVVLNLIENQKAEIEILETDKQKLIEKLEKDIKYGKEFELDLEPTIPEIRAEYAQEILEIVKGVENERDKI